MSILDTATPFTDSSSTLIHTQLALLDFLVFPQQKSAKSALDILIKCILPTLRTSHSALFFKKGLFLFPRPCLLSPSLPLPILPHSSGISGNFKKLFSIAVAHILCHQVPRQELHFPLIPPLCWQPKSRLSQYFAIRLYVSPE